MTSISERLASLSPERRAQLESRLLRERPVSRGRGIPRRREGSACALSFAQQRLWFLEQFEPGLPLYNVHRALRLKGTFDVDAARRAFDAIVKRHEALRTTYITLDDDPVQQINPPVDVPFEVTRVPAGARGERDEALRQCLSAAMGRPFDLSRDPMLRCALFQLDADDQVLLVSIHHIASDGWSLDVLLREFAELYNAEVSGRPARLADLPLQYADFAVWQRGYLQGPVLQKQLSFWTERLRGAPQVLDLPTDFPRPALDTFCGDRELRSLPRELCRELGKLCRDANVTRFMALLAAYQVLLSRYTGQEDLLVGTPVAGRNRVELEPLIGLFVNTLVLRADLSDDPSFRTLLRRTRDVTLSAQAHQELPFEKLVEELQPARSLSHAPMFQVMFGLHNVPHTPLRIPGIKSSIVPLNSGTAKYDLNLELWESEGGLRASAEYNTDLFRPETAQRLLGHFQKLLEAAVSDPDCRVSRLPFITAGERTQILVDWNATETPQGDRFPPVHEMFEDQVERTPERVAAEFDAQRLTYRELNVRANRLAHYLRERGVGQETLVGVCVERGLDMLVAVLAVAKSGAAYVPLDPAFPPARLKYMLEDSQAAVLLTQSDLLPELPEGDRQIVCLDRQAGVFARHSDDNPSAAVDESSLAYVIYTSGSTGRPKGTEITHGALSNFLLSMCREPGLDAEDVLLSVTTLSFDIAALELFLPLIVGARVVIVSREVAVDGERLIEALQASRATVMQATPATWRLLLQAGKLPGGVKVLCGGEALARELADSLGSQAAELWNMYGPTETTIWSTVDKVDADDDVMIGRPIDNTAVYVLDRHEQPVPIGVPGELFIGGKGLARGYWNDPQRTAERFRTDPFSRKAGARMYRTGDLVRWRADGKLECLGRTDHQVKIRGHRIELGEIETLLVEVASVREAVVIAADDASGEKRLVAYLVPAPGQEVQAAALQHALAEELPSYMVPPVFVCLDALPLTPNGKVDRKALPAPDESRLQAIETYVPPRTPLERELAELWASLLQVERVGIEDNFFDLGGHSMLAARLFARLSKRRQRVPPLASLFRAPTIEQFAALLERDETGTPRSSLVQIQSGGTRPPFFCMHLLGGHVMGYHKIAPHLGPDQPVYGVEAFGLDGKHPPHRRVEEMAASYVNDIRALQPKGPYFLGGICFGGLLAFEMAQQLVAQGQTVGLLVLIETQCRRKAALSGTDRIRRRIRRSTRKVKLYWRQFHELNREQRVAFVLKRVRHVSRFKMAAWRLSRSVYSRFGGNLPQVFKLRKLSSINFEAGRLYYPSAYPGQITLFVSRESPEYGDNDPRLGWRDLAGQGVDVQVFEGSHDTIHQEPYLSLLGTQLRECLRKAQASSTTGGHGPAAHTGNANGNGKTSAGHLSTQLE